MQHRLSARRHGRTLGHPAAEAHPCLEAGPKNAASAGLLSSLQQLTVSSCQPGPQPEPADAQSSLLPAPVGRGRTCRAIAGQDSRLGRAWGLQTPDLRPTWHGNTLSDRKGCVSQGQILRSWVPLRSHGSHLRPELRSGLLPATEHELRLHCQRACLVWRQRGDCV